MPKLEITEEPLIIVSDADKLISSESKRTNSLNILSNKATNNLISQEDIDFNVTTGVKNTIVTTMTSLESLEKRDEMKQ